MQADRSEFCSLKVNTRRKPTKWIGRCTVCRNRDQLEKHHSKPKVGRLKRRGPIWGLCPICHYRAHSEIGNKLLRELSIKELRFELWAELDEL